MRAYRCYTNGCGKGLITDLQEWGPCPVCGGKKWGKVQRVTYWIMFRLWWMSGRQLVVPPEGSWLERYLIKRMEDQADEKLPPFDPNFKGGSR